MNSEIPPIVVLPLKSKGLNNLSEVDQVTPGKLWSFEAAITSPHNFDACVLPYVVPENERQTCRINSGVLEELKKAGQEPLLNYIFIDVDNTAHRPFESLGQAQHTLDSLPWQEHPLKEAGAYTTRAGYRLIWRLEQPLRASLASSFLRQFIAHLLACGIPADLQCVDWNRLYRLPYVQRDGERLEGVVRIQNLLDGKTLSWVPPKPLQEISYAASRTHGDVPEPRDPTQAEWDVVLESPFAGRYFDRILRGLELGEVGERHKLIMRLCASLASKGDCSNPEPVFQLLYRSVANDKRPNAPTLPQLWKMASWAADRVAEKQELREKARQMHPIVFHGTNYYVLDSQQLGYRPPVSGTALVQALERYCGDLQLKTRNGKARACRPTPELLADYGVQATQVIMEMGRSKTTFKDDTLIESCCPEHPRLIAQHHPDVAEWLNQFGGEKVEKLLDWLATASNLEEPTCALYLRGKKAVGKGLFASGVAQVWGSDPVPYEDAVGKFNERLADCPVVFADEKMQLSKDENFSSKFRSLIAERTRRFRRMYRPPAILRGCPRLIVAANNDDALSLREQLTRDDVEAIAQRILYIQIPDALSGQLTMEQTRDWVRYSDGSPGKIAQHLKYLQRVRKVTPGRRFLVEGELERFHNDLALNAGINQQVLSAIAVAAGLSELKGIRFDNPKGILVNPPDLLQLWSVLVSTKSPTLGNVSNALRALSEGQMRCRVGNGPRKRYYVISRETVLRAAQTLQIGDETLEEKIKNC